MATVVDSERSARVRGLAATNRSTSTPDIEFRALRRDVPVVVDTIGVHGPVSDHRLPRQRHEDVIDLRTGEVAQRNLSAYGVEVAPDVHLKVDYRREVPHASFEMSVPTVLSGVNIHGASLQDTRRAVKDCYDQARAAVTWVVPWEHLSVSRLDIDRDFQDVHDIPAVLDALQGVPCHRANLNQRFADPKTGGTQTLVRGSKGRWKATLYDKQAQVRHLATRARTPYERQFLRREAIAARGRLRFEVSVRTDALHQRGIREVSDLSNETNLADMAHNYFTRAGYGQEVGGMTKLDQVLRIMACDGLNYKNADRMLGILLLDALHLPQSASENTVDKHLKIARSYGLSPADLTTFDRSTVLLDYASGRASRGSGS